MVDNLDLWVLVVGVSIRIHISIDANGINLEVY